MWTRTRLEKSMGHVTLGSQQFLALGRVEKGLNDQRLNDH